MREGESEGECTHHSPPELSRREDGAVLPAAAEAKVEGAILEQGDSAKLAQGATVARGNGRGEG